MLRGEVTYLGKPVPSAVRAVLAILERLRDFDKLVARLTKVRHVLTEALCMARDDTRSRRIS